MVRSTLLCRFSEGPFGQKISFNANVLFSKISQQIDSGIESIIENESHLQNLQCLTIRINVIKSKFSRDCVENFWGFVRPGVSFLAKIESSQNCSRSFQTKVFKLLRCFWWVNGAQHSPLSLAVALQCSGAAAEGTATAALPHGDALCASCTGFRFGRRLHLFWMVG